MRIGILTGGGDAPGLNGIIEAAGKSLLRMGYEVIGIRDGFSGIFERRVTQLKWADLEGVHCLSGTVLGTTNRCGTEGREQEFLEKYLSLNLEGLVVAGGDGTFRGLEKIDPKVRVIGAPKTIDNDLLGTEITFGFDTACSVVSEAIDALKYTAQAHGRIILVETMGRTSGWIALGGGLVAYADAVLIPERPLQAAQLLKFLEGRQSQGSKGLVFAVSEGASLGTIESNDLQGTEGVSGRSKRVGGVSECLARWLEKETQWECRHVVLGHLQRARSPTTTDRFLTMTMGALIGRLVKEQKWNSAVVYRNGRVVPAPLSEIIGPPRLVSDDHRWVSLAQTLGIFV